MPSRGSTYAVAFTTGLSLVCALLLTGLSVALADRQARNRTLDEKKNILGVLQVVADPRALSPEVIEAAYAANVAKERKRVDAQRSIIVYTFRGSKPSAPAQAYAFVVDGMGLWAPVKGLLAVEPDLETIRGVSFYHHEETPGLGGRISERGFTSTFEGKSLLGPDRAPGIEIVARPKQRNQVDAITGATLTCDSVQRFVNDDIRAFLKAMKAAVPK